MAVSGLGMGDPQVAGPDWGTTTAVVMIPVIVRATTLCGYGNDAITEAVNVIHRAIDRADVDGTISLSSMDWRRVVVIQGKVDEPEDPDDELNRQLATVGEMLYDTARLRHDEYAAARERAFWTAYNEAGRDDE